MKKTTKVLVTFDVHVDEDSPDVTDAAADTAQEGIAAAMKQVADIVDGAVSPSSDWPLP